ncbi:mitochondrial E3 ubiquitin protein ligase 1 [Anabrus simplex]|uniref:mitochondrial E3 ubiquitin protein ligase 1 n=1 Tax=Anabrus simplex TaxID=316456 RepID=UPI0034DD68C3
MDYFGEVLLLGIDSIILGICFKCFLKTRKAAKTIQDVPVYDINHELEELVATQSDQKIPYAAIRGTVKAIGSPLRSINSPIITGVVQRLSVKEHVVTRSTAGFWSDQERTIQEVYNCVPFVLCARNTDVEILDPLTADVLDLETIADKFEPTNSSLIDHIWGFFTGVRQRGLQSTEEILREGVLITGIGELGISNTSGAAIRLQPPSSGAPFYITVLPIPSLVRRLEQQKRTYGYLTLIFGCVGMVIAGFVTHRWWKDRTRRRNDEDRRRRLEESRRFRRQRVREANVPDSQACVVCRENPREIIILPCGHVCLCEDCSDVIMDVCPVCRSVIDKKAAAYL